MLNIEYLKAKNNKVEVAKYKVVTRRYLDFEKTIESFMVDSMTEEEYIDHRDNYVAKHKLFDIVELEELDTSNYNWVTEITLPDNTGDSLEKIALCNSKEEYEASLEQNKDLYLLDIEERISLLELGI